MMARKTHRPLEKKHLKGRENTSIFSLHRQTVNGSVLKVFGHCKPESFRNAAIIQSKTR